MIWPEHGVFVCMYVYMYVCTYICMYVFTCMYACVWINTWSLGDIETGQDIEYTCTYNWLVKIKEDRTVTQLIGQY